MAKSNTRVCLTCGCHYKYCAHRCGEDEKKPLWHTLFHNQNCHDIWYVLSDYESGKLSKEEALNQIKKLDVSVVTNKEALKSYEKLLNDTKPVINEESAPVEEIPPVEAEEISAESSEPDEILTVSEELKKHNTRRVKTNKK